MGIEYFYATDGLRVAIDKIKLVGKIRTSTSTGLHYWFSVFTFEGAAYTAAYNTEFEAVAVREVLKGRMRWPS